MTCLTEEAQWDCEQGVEKREALEENSEPSVTEKMKEMYEGYTRI